MERYEGKAGLNTPDAPGPSMLGEEEALQKTGYIMMVKDQRVVAQVKRLWKAKMERKRKIDNKQI